MSGCVVIRYEMLLLGYLWAFFLGFGVWDSASYPPFLLCFVGMYVHMSYAL